MRRPLRVWPTAVLAAACLAGSAPALDLTTATVEAVPGRRILVPVTLTAARDVASVALKFNYEPAVLQWTAAYRGTFGRQFALGVKAEDGTVDLILVRREAGTAPGGELVYLGFEVNPGALADSFSEITIARREFGGASGADLGAAAAIVHTHGGVRVLSSAWMADTDANGVPDWWEQQHFGRLLGAAISEDSDGDGVSNRDEFLAGTDPRDPTSKPGIAALDLEGNRVLVQFATTSGKLYQLQHTDGLGGLGWTDLGEVVVGTGQMMQVIDTLQAGSWQRFYRLKILAE